MTIKQLNMKLLALCGQFSSIDPINSALVILYLTVYGTVLTMAVVMKLWLWQIHSQNELQKSTDTSTNTHMHTLTLAMEILLYTFLLLLSLRWVVWSHSRAFAAIWINLYLNKTRKWIIKWLIHDVLCVCVERHCIFHAFRAQIHRPTHQHTSQSTMFQCYNRTLPHSAVLCYSWVVVLCALLCVCACKRFNLLPVNAHFHFVRSFACFVVRLFAHFFFSCWLNWHSNLWHGLCSLPHWLQKKNFLMKWTHTIS